MRLWIVGVVFLILMGGWILINKDDPIEITEIMQIEKCALDSSGTWDTCLNINLKLTNNENKNKDFLIFGQGIDLDGGSLSIRGYPGKDTIQLYEPCENTYNSPDLYQLQPHASENLSYCFPNIGIAERPYFIISLLENPPTTDRETIRWMSINGSVKIKRYIFYLPSYINGEKNEIGTTINLLIKSISGI